MMLVTRGGMTFSEIIEQPAHWQNAIKVYNKERETLVWMKKSKFEQVVFIGAGASHYAAVYASYLFKRIAGMNAIAVQPSDVFLSEELPFQPNKRTLVVIISRSGQTDETNWAAELIKAKEPDTQIMSFVCVDGTPLTEVSDKVILLDEAIDDIAIPVRSFSTTLFMISLVAGAIGGNAELLGELSKLPKAIDVRKFYDLIVKMRKLQEAKNLILLGSGQNVPLASYGSLIFKEMSLTPSNTYNTFEYRHNHFVAASLDTLIITILSDEAMDMEIEAMRDGARMKAQVGLIAEDLDAKIEAGVEYAIKLCSGMSEYARTFYIIPCLQLLAFQHAVMKGMNPDKPRHLVDIVKYKSLPASVEE